MALMAKKFRVVGRVQGVGFRYYTCRLAETLNFAGYVANLDDGAVEVYAIGSEAVLAQLQAGLEQGPRLAEVTAVLAETVGFERFSFDQITGRAQT